MEIELISERHEIETSEAAFIHAETAEFSEVGELPELFTLHQTEDDVREVSLHLGLKLGGFNFVFTLEGEGEYLRAFGCYSLGLNSTLFEIPVP